MEAVVIVEEDGTDKLCLALYGEVKTQKILGGSDAAMLYDAADMIFELKKKIEYQQDLLDNRAMKSVPNPHPDHYREYRPQDDRAVNDDYLNNDKELSKAIGNIECDQCSVGQCLMISKTLKYPGLADGGIMIMDVELMCNECGCKQTLKVPIYEGRYGVPEVTQITASARNYLPTHDNWSSGELE